VANLPAATVLISVRDASESVSRIVLYVADGTSIAGARAAVQGLLGPLSQISGCSVLGYSVTYATHLSDERGDAGQLVSSRGLFVWATGQVEEYAVTYLPGIKAALVDSITAEINQSDAGIAALAAEILAGPWVNPFGYPVTGLENAFYQVDP
jgi:hypothetical protein